MSPKDMGDRRGYSDQKKYERLVLATEIQNLKDFEAILKVASIGITKINIPKQFFQPRHKHFIMKSFTDRPEAVKPVAEVAATENWQFSEEKEEV
jgi:hypothetical protein